MGKPGRAPRPQLQNKEFGAIAKSDRKSTGEGDGLPPIGSTVAPAPMSANHRPLARYRGPPPKGTHAKKTTANDISPPRWGEFVESARGATIPGRNSNVADSAAPMDSYYKDLVIRRYRNRRIAQLALNAMGFRKRYKHIIGRKPNEDSGRSRILSRQIDPSTG